MPLASTNVKADPDKIELAKLKGINLSQLFRDALDVSLSMPGSDTEMLLVQLAKVRKQKRMLDLEEKLILDQLDKFDSDTELEIYRETKYMQWKTPITFQLKKNTFNWDMNTKLFQFSNVAEFKKWLLDKLKSDKLIE